MANNLQRMDYFQNKGFKREMRLKNLLSFFIGHFETFNRRLGANSHPEVSIYIIKIAIINILRMAIN